LKSRRWEGLAPKLLVMLDFSKKRPKN
jgi:hypothetical protein